MMGTVTAEVRNVHHGPDETPAIVGICWDGGDGILEENHSLGLKVDWNQGRRK